jgi:hypothetical protein
MKRTANRIISAMLVLMAITAGIKASAVELN